MTSLQHKPVDTREFSSTTRPVLHGTGYTHTTVALGILQKAHCFHNKYQWSILLWDPFHEGSQSFADTQPTYHPCLSWTHAGAKECLQRLPIIIFVRCGRYRVSSFQVSSPMCGPKIQFLKKLWVVSSSINLIFESLSHFQTFLWIQRLHLRKLILA